MPEIGVRHRIPCPVRLLSVDEDDARIGVAFVGVRPDVVVSGDRVRRALAGSLEPGMLVRRVINNELSDNADAARMRRGDEILELG